VVSVPVLNLADAGTEIWYRAKEEKNNTWCRNKKIETFIFLLKTRQRNLFLCHTDNRTTYSILSWQRLRPEVGVFLWAHINECPFLQ
jgi:hypothetical protein